LQPWPSILYQSHPGPFLQRSGRIMSIVFIPIALNSLQRETDTFGPLSKPKVREHSMQGILWWRHCSRRPFLNQLELDTWAVFLFSRQPRTRAEQPKYNLGFLPPTINFLPTAHWHFSPLPNSPPTPQKSPKVKPSRCQDKSLVASSWCPCAPARDAEPAI